MDERIAALAQQLGVSYEAAEQAVYAGRYQDEMAVLDEQMAYAQGLRDTAGPEGRQAGRVYVAANPLEHLGTYLRRRRGNQEVGRVEGERTAAMDRRDQAATAIAEIQAADRRAYMDALRGPRELQGPPEPPVASPAPTVVAAQPQPQPQPQPAVTQSPAPPQNNLPAYLRRPQETPFVQSFNDAARTAAAPGEQPQGYGVGFTPGGSNADRLAARLREWGSNFPRPWERQPGRNVGAGLRLRGYGSN